METPSSYTERELEILQWWRSIVYDARFDRIRRMVRDQIPFGSMVEETPHGQNVADGFRQGVQKVFDGLEDIANVETMADGPGVLGYEVQALHPDLDDEIKES
jgi:hypothetical protein